MTLNLVIYEGYRDKGMWHRRKKGDEEIKKGKHQRRIAKPCSAVNRDRFEEGVGNHGDLL